MSQRIQLHDSRQSLSQSLETAQDADVVSITSGEESPAMRVSPFLLYPAMLLFASSARAQPESAKYTEWIQDAAEAVPQTIVTACGVTRGNRPIPALVTSRFLDLKSDRTRVLIIAGFESSTETIQSALQFWKDVHTEERFKEHRAHVDYALIPVANPDGAALGLGRKNSGGGVPLEAFPPKGTAYSDPTNPEAHYIWRWTGMLAPDSVSIRRPGEAVILRSVRKGKIRETSPPLNSKGGGVVVRPFRHEGLLFTALQEAHPAGIGPFRAGTEVVRAEEFLKAFRDTVPFSARPATPARQELLSRLGRSPVEVAEQLRKVYGHQLNSVAYIPALALIGRLRLGELTENAGHQKDVEDIVRPYVNDSKPTMGKRTSGSNLSGHLVFGEMADRTSDKRYIELAKAAADLGFDENGQPRESMPYHNEMSDAVFMGGPILVQVGRLTGDTKYFDMALRHIRFMLKLNLREDGLHQHSPLDPAGTAWGRGNGFPALGMALCLSDLPKDSPHRDEMLSIYRNHMAAMLKHQDEMGMWHQVVDHVESYRELTVTCMTTFAMTRGLRRGWLDAETYRPAVQRAWEAIKTRISRDGQLVDVCTGTGKQKSFRAYLDRTAILGRDDRGGAMALMVSTEIAFAEREGVLEAVR